MAKTVLNFTRAALDSLPLPASGKRLEMYDKQVPDLMVRITSTGAKTFTVYRRVNRKPQRVKLGRYPDMTIEQARKAAQKAVGRMVDGVDLVAEKRVAKATSVTLKQVFQDYLKAHDLKSGTVKEYGRCMNETFPDWLTKPITKISKDMVARRYQSRGQESKARANASMRVLRALFNFAVANYDGADGQPIIQANPVKLMLASHSWYKVKRRKTYIKPHQLPAWFKAVLALEAERSTGQAATARDYFITLLLTGLRREEGASLTWSKVDLQGKTLTVTDTKNHEDHTLPLSNYLYDLLERRKREADKGAKYVFAIPGGYLNDPRTWIEKVVKESGVEFTLHDLRRTFATVAESLGVSIYAIKRLLNHKASETDVTEDYVSISGDRLGKLMQEITAHILMLAEVKPTAEVIELKTVTR